MLPLMIREMWLIHCETSVGETPLKRRYRTEDVMEIHSQEASSRGRDMPAELACGINPDFIYIIPFFF